MGYQLYNGECYRGNDNVSTKVFLYRSDFSVRADNIITIVIIVIIATSSSSSSSLLGMFLLPLLFYFAIFIHKSPNLYTFLSKFLTCMTIASVVIRGDRRNTVSLQFPID